jgi:hypothetical protein
MNTALSLTKEGSTERAQRVFDEHRAIYDAPSLNRALSTPHAGDPQRRCRPDGRSRGGTVMGKIALPPP